MKKQFAPYELALKLKELGFNEMCIATFDEDNNFELQDFQQSYDTFPKHIISAPLWQQAFDWFERKHFAYSHIYPEFIGSDEWEYSFKIDYLPREKQGLKRRGTSFECIKSFKLGIDSYIGAWSDKIKAREACLEKLIELCQQN